MKKLMVLILIFLMSISNSYALEKVTFASCVDGDTIKVDLNGEEKTVRLLAIDTPESVHPKKKVEYYGKEASEYTCNLITKAKKIELEYDNNSDKTDKYGRILAWVFVDDKLLEEKLVEYGYAKVAYLYGDYKYTDVLYEKQEIAQVNNLGIWNTYEKEKYDSNDNNSNVQDSIKDVSYSNQDIIMIIVLLLIVVFVGDKSVKKKANKKLKSYLK